MHRQTDPSFIISPQEKVINIRAGERKGGSEPGGWVTVVSNKDDSSKVYLAKKDTIENALQSKIILDFYRVFAKTPKAYIALLDEMMATGILSTFFQGNGSEENARLFAEGGNVRLNKRLSLFNWLAQQDERLAPFLFSERIEGYKDLGAQFVDVIKKTGRPPEEIEYEEGITLPLRGFMSIAAIAWVLDDCDFLGGSGGNTGYVIEYNEHGPYGKAVLVDEKALTPIPIDEKIATPKDILIGAQSGIYIRYDALTKAQKDEFLQTLFKLSELDEKELMKLITKEGEYEKIYGQHLPSHYFSSLMFKIKENIKIKCALLAQDLAISSRQAIHDFAANGELNSLSELIHFGCDLEEKAFNDMTPLLIAAEHKQLEAAKLLIGANANTDAQNKYGENALHLAIKNEDKEMLTLVAKADPSLITKPDADGNTPLHLAVINGNLVFLKILLTHLLTSPTLPNLEGKTPLHLALEYAEKGTYPWNAVIMLALETPSSDKEMANLLLPYAYTLKKAISDLKSEEAYEVIKKLEQGDSALKNSLQSSSPSLMGLFGKVNQDIQSIGKAIEKTSDSLIKSLGFTSKGS